MLSKILDLKGVKSFSIIEVLIGISVGLIGALAGYALIISMKQYMAGGSEVVRTQQEARVILERITRELRESSPDKVWPDSLRYSDSDYIIFYTPRNDKREFIVGTDGRPRWQRAIRYRLDSVSNRLLRDQMYISDATGIPIFSTYHSEVVSKNVEKLLFRRDKDLVIISIRTFGDKNKTKNMADAFTDLNTRIKMRN